MDRVFEGFTHFHLTKKDSTNLLLVRFNFWFQVIRIIELIRY